MQSQRLAFAFKQLEEMAMHDRIGKKKIIEQLATRMSTDEQVASEWLEATLEALYDAFKQSDLGTLYDAFKQDDSVPSTTPVLQPLTPEARESIQGDEIKLDKFPFRVGRECRVRMVDGSPHVIERRKLHGPPNNDLYLLDRGRRLNVSREHFQIEKKEDGTYELVDRGSACGTIVGNQAIGGSDKGGRCPLKDGDVIVVGTSESQIVFRFLLPSE